MLSQSHLNGVLVQSFEGFQEDQLAGADSGATGTLEGEDNVLSVELVAVLEGDVLAELEDQLSIGDPFPGGCQFGLDFTGLAVVVGQTVMGHAEHVVMSHITFCLGVDGTALQVGANDHALLIGVGLYNGGVGCAGGTSCHSTGIGDTGVGDGCFGCCFCCGSSCRSFGTTGAAAACQQGQNHDKAQYQGNEFFHNCSSLSCWNEMICPVGFFLNKPARLSDFKIHRFFRKALL